MIGIISLGISNITSLKSAIDVLNFKSFLIEEPNQILYAEKILLPGVGNFKEAMKRLRKSGLDKALKKAASNGIPIMGICLGMQLLADKGYEGSEDSEGSETKGLGLIPGEVRQITGNNIKLPHMGWNTLHIKKNNKILSSDFNNIDYYFIHSFEFVVKNNENLLATVEYGKQVTAVVGNNNIFGCQFHPEKSQRAGLELLKSFITNAKT